MNEISDLSGVVKAYDVRGRAGEQLTAPVCEALGAAFADFLDAGPLVVAHDMRVSSPELSEAFVRGAVRRGCTVAVAGLSSTDQLYCASALHRAAGAMFTASHNPAADNGIKMCLSGARPVGRGTGLEEIRAAAESYLRAGSIPAREGGRAESVETLEPYVDTLLGLVRVPSRRRLRVVVDAANAMAGLTMPAVAARLDSVDVVPLHFELDGTFPHHEANPLDPANLQDLQAAVLEHGADLGLAFDGDADRCIAVDERGQVIPPSAVTALIAQREIARARAGGEAEPAVVANLVSSRHVQEAIAQAGGVRIRSRVGHSLIKALMAQHDAVFGGEHSAHYYFRDFFFADSGMLAALHLLAALAESDGTASQLVAQHDPYAASGEINSRVADVPAATARARAAAEEMGAREFDDLDGMTAIHWDDAADAAERWWFSLRASNTEPLLRLNVEAAEPGTMERVRDAVLAAIRVEQPSPQAPAREAQAPAGDAEAAARAHAPEGGRQLPGWVRAAVRCPGCRGELVGAEGSFSCARCGSAYPVREGIAMLIPHREA